VYLIGQTLNFKGYYIIGIQDHLLERVLVSGQKIKIFCFRSSVFWQSVPASRGCLFIRFGTELLFLPSRQWILRALVCYFLFLFKQTVFQKSSNIIKLIHLLTLNHFSFYYQRYHFFQTLKLQKFSRQTIIPQRVRASGIV
jgi:hypothetical protein